MGFNELLEAGDVPGLMAAWPKVVPHLPVPTNYDRVEIAMHLARTSNEFITLRSRAYSHRWLTERDIPSQLPDHLKPSAERLYPVVVEAVGISVNAKNPYLRPAMLEVRKAMEDAVMDAHAGGRLSDSVFVKEQMSLARDREMFKLFGR